MDKSLQLVGRFLPYRVYARWKWTVRFGLFALPLVVFLTGSILLYLAPTKYESKALLEYQGTHTPSEAAALLKSRNVLVEVCEALQLDKRWSYGKDNVVDILKDVTKTEVDPSGLIEVTVTHTEKEVARDVAAELPKALTRYENRLATNGIESRLQALRRAVRNDEDRAEERRKSYLQLIAVRGEQPTDPASKLDVSASRIEWEEGCRRVMVEKGRIADLELEAASLGKSFTVHADPIISGSRAGTKTEDSFAEITWRSLGSGLLFALLAPYLFEFACPFYRRPIVAARPKRDSTPDNEWAVPAKDSDLVATPLNG